MFKLMDEKIFTILGSISFLISIYEVIFYVQLCEADQSSGKCVPVLSFRTGHKKNVSFLFKSVFLFSYFLFDISIVIGCQ